MTTKDEALKQALEALEYSDNCLAEIAAAAELLAAAMKVNALSIQTDAHKELRAAIANATGDDGDDRGHRCGQCDDYVDRNGHVRAAIREALAQKDEHEPVAWVDVKDTHQGPYDFHGIDYMPEGKHLLYTAPPKRKPLTDEKLRAMWVNYAPIVGGVLEFARAIERAHGIGENT